MIDCCGGAQLSKDFARLLQELLGGCHFEQVMA